MTIASPTTDRRSSARARRSLRDAALIIALAALAAGVGAALYFVARQVAAGNSDGATVVLEGQAMAAGHLLLKGWSLSLDSFWSVDVPFYAVAVRIAGLSPTLMNLVPAAIAALVVLVCAYLVYNRGGRYGAVGALAVTIFLAFPSRTMALFFVQGPYHVATLLWCLIAFIAMERDTFGLRFFVAVLFLAAGILGDLQTLLLGVAPMVATALVLGHLRRDLAPVKGMLAAPFAAGVLALCIREITRIFGTFAVPRANTFASAHQFLRNIAHLPGLFAALLGFDQGPFGPTGVPLGLALLHLLGLGLVVGGPVVVAIGLLAALRRSGGKAVDLEPSTRMDTLLLFTFCAGLAQFLVLPITSSDAYARYLVPAVVAGATLGGRVVARTLARSTHGRRRMLLEGAAGLLVCTMGASFGFELQGGAATGTAQPLGAFLAAHHLYHGIGDYWDASVITVTSKGTVTIRPVIEASGKLVRYDKQSAASWYGSENRFNFFVFNTGAVWNGVAGAPAVRTFGQPSEVYPFGTYRIYVWSRPFTVSVHGSTGP